MVELMVVVAIIGILMRIAIPMYSHYVLRGDLQEAPGQLASYRLAMEQYYQDNRSYANSGACGVAVPTGTYFTFSCVATATTYTLTATGVAGPTSGYSYTINEANVQTTTAPAGAACTSSTSSWVTKC